MNFRAVRFNPYLIGLVAIAAIVTTGCISLEQRNRDRVFYTELWLHAAKAGAVVDTNNVMAVTVAGSSIPVHSRPFLTEEALEEATIIESPGGGYSLQLRFNQHGMLVLDGFTAGHRGQQVGIFVRYGVRKKKDVPLTEAWIAAPMVTRRITDGLIVFTPNVDRDELIVIVDGLRNAIEVNDIPWVF